jgi:hypothetical protein
MTKKGRMRIGFHGYSLQDRPTISPIVKRRSGLSLRIPAIVPLFYSPVGYFSDREPF